jgi:hypothetical protein
MDAAVEVFIPAYCCIVFTILIDCAHDIDLRRRMPIVLESGVVTEFYVSPYRDEHFYIFNVHTE